MCRVGSIHVQAILTEWAQFMCSRGAAQSEVVAQALMAADLTSLLVSSRPHFTGGATPLPLSLPVAARADVSSEGAVAAIALPCEAPWPELEDVSQIVAAIQRKSKFKWLHFLVSARCCSHGLETSDCLIVSSDARTATWMQPRLKRSLACVVQ